MKTMFSKAGIYLRWIIGALAGILIILLLSDQLLRSDIEKLIIIASCTVIMISGIFFDLSTYDFRLDRINSLQMIIRDKWIHTILATFASVFVIISILCHAKIAAIICGIWIIVSTLCAMNLNKQSNTGQIYKASDTQNNVTAYKKLVIISGTIYGVLLSMLVLAIITKAVDLVFGLEIFVASCVLMMIMCLCVIVLHPIEKNRQDKKKKDI